MTGIPAGIPVFLCRIQGCRSLFVLSYSARLCLPGSGRDKRGNGRTCFQRKWKRLSGWGCLVSPVCRLRFAGGLPCAGCGLPAVCPAPVDWVVAVALFSVSGTAAGSGGKPPPVRKTEKNHSTKKRMFQRNIRKNEERFSENITTISVLASEILVS